MAVWSVVDMTFDYLNCCFHSSDKPGYDHDPRACPCYNRPRGAPGETLGMEPEKAEARAQLRARTECRIDSFPLGSVGKTADLRYYSQLPSVVHYHHPRILIL